MTIKGLGRYAMVVFKAAGPSNIRIATSHLTPKVCTYLGASFTHHMYMRIGLPHSNNHNIRSAVLNFYIPHAVTLHGFGGYFETVLYGDISLSIHPDTKDSKSPNMLSWFPLFFPLKVNGISLLRRTTAHCS